MSRNRENKARAWTPAVLGAFFVFAAAMCALAGASLLTPGGRLDWIWRVKPDEYRQLVALGPPAGEGFLALALVMALASYGTYRRRHWGWRLAIAIFAVNAAADAARIPLGAALEGAIGVVATGVILWWLLRAKVRAAFER
jgi:hypothetical protein